MDWTQTPYWAWLEIWPAAWLSLLGKACRTGSSLGSWAWG